METTNNILNNKAFRFGFVLLAIAFALYIATAAFNRNEISDRKSIGELPTITVTGKGEAYATPDVSVISYEVRKEAKTLTESQKLANEIINPLKDALIAAGIAEKDIKTVNYSTYPQYDYVQTSARPCAMDYCPPVNSRPVIRGYETAGNFEVKVRDAEKAGEIATLLGSKGVTSVGNIQFVVENPDAVSEAARADAIADAKAKAKKLASDLGVRIVRIVAFNESQGGYYPNYMSARVMDEKASGDAVMVPAPELPTGEQKTQSNVTITFEIR